MTYNKSKSGLDNKSILNNFSTRYPTLKEAGKSVQKASRLIIKAFRSNHPLFICGNGGSFSDAQHIKGELGKSFEMMRPLNASFKKKVSKLPMGKQLVASLENGFPVLVLGESPALQSAFNNDQFPVTAFAQELHSFLCQAKKPKGVFFGISTSGNSQNIIAAANTAKAHGISTIALTGPRKNSPLGKAVDLLIAAPGESTAEIQEHHLPLYHLLCRFIESELV